MSEVSCEILADGEESSLELLSFLRAICEPVGQNGRTALSEAVGGKGAADEVQERRGTGQEPRADGLGLGYPCAVLWRTKYYTRQLTLGGWHKDEHTHTHDDSHTHITERQSPSLIFHAGKLTDKEKTENGGLRLRIRSVWDGRHCELDVPSSWRSIDPKVLRRRQRSLASRAEAELSRDSQPRFGANACQELSAAERLEKFVHALDDVRDFLDVCLLDIADDTGEPWPEPVTNVRGAVSTDDYQNLPVENGIESQTILLDEIAMQIQRSRSDASIK